VTALQVALAHDGCFNLAPTGYYGAITAQSVMKFQTKHHVASTAEIASLGGNLVGPATRAALNSLPA
jgi:peptidoglycan hydrolase-like protein with peptidoglycan-binding domain